MDRNAYVAIGVAGREGLRHGETGACPPSVTAGTAIATVRGPVSVENLRPGDRVLTRDNGYRPLLWVGCARLEGAALVRHPDTRPVTIPANFLGAGMPARDLAVSPQHRLLLSGEHARRFGTESELLVEACEIAAALDAALPESGAVSYFQLMFDRHEVILADGLWTESFFPSRDALEALGAHQRDEVIALVADLQAARGGERFAAARLRPAAGRCRAVPQAA